jgi:6-pyruvoyltetrahydropterin/6-carboxytetrahydropterin synthase
MIHLTREVRFSADRDWDRDEALATPVGNAWAGWPAAAGPSPYLRLQATVAGEPDPASGYLCNIKLIDDLLRARAIPLTLALLAEAGPRLTVERLLRAVWERVAPATPPGSTLTRLRLFPAPYLHYTIRRERPEVIQLTEQFEFSAAHRLHCPELSDEENRRLFGKCNNPRGPGHNYVLEVTVAGQPDPASGLVCSRQQLQQAVKQRVIDRLDHKHLNEDTEEFGRLNPTVENIARVVWGLLAGHLGAARLARVRVYETPKTWADYRG